VFRHSMREEERSRSGTYASIHAGVPAPRLASAPSLGAVASHPPGQDACCSGVRWSTAEASTMYATSSTASQKLIQYKISVEAGASTAAPPARPQYSQPSRGVRELRREGRGEIHARHSRKDQAAAAGGAGRVGCGRTAVR
jgi:hypothetical protein